MVIWSIAGASPMSPPDRSSAARCPALMSSGCGHGRSLVRLLHADPVRWQALQAVRSLQLEDGWIGAGFVRDAVWDHLHGQVVSLPFGDVDVVWFDHEHPGRAADRIHESMLAALMPQLRWSVKNQARMHRRNGDAAYLSVADAIARWPETATAVAVRLDAGGRVEIMAPWGLDDLFDLRLRPTPAFSGDKHPIYRQRVAAKAWLQRYPGLHVE